MSMKNIKRFLLSAAIAAAAAIVTGCGGELNTVMNLNSDFSGQRVMTLTVNKEENAEYVHGEQNAITETVKNNCPAELSFQASDDGANVIYTFTLDFADREDYEAKVRTLLGESVSADEGVISYAAPDSVFAKGVQYDEEFTSSDILGWFSELMINSGYIDSSDRSYIFEEQATAFNYDGAPMESGSNTRVKVDTLSFRAINGVDFYTTANADGTFDRRIEIKIPQATMDEAGDEIKAFLEPKAAGVAGSWESEEGINTYVIEGTGLNAEEIDAMTKNFTGKAEGTSFALDNEAEPETIDESEGSAEGKNDINAADTEENAENKDGADDTQKAEEAMPGDPYLLYTHNEIREKINLEDYITNDRGRVDFNYYAGSGTDYEGVYAEGGADINSAGSNIHYQKEAAEGIPEGYYRLFSGNDFIYETDYSATSGFNAERIEISVKLGGADTITKTISADYGDELSDEAVTALKEKLEAAAKDTGVEIKKCEKTDNGFNVTVAIKANSEETDEAWYKFVGGSMSSDVFADTKRALAPSKTVHLSDSTDISAFTNKSIGELIYRAESIGKPVNEDYEGEFEGSDYVIKRTDVDPAELGAVEMEITAVKSNPLVYVLYIAAIASVLNLLYRAKGLLLLGAGKAMAKASEKKKEKAVKAGEAPANGETSKKKFCGSCGAENEADAGFCEKCGAKIE